MAILFFFECASDNGAILRAPLSVLRKKWPKLEQKYRSTCESFSIPLKERYRWVKYSWSSAGGTKIQMNIESDIYGS